MNQPPYANGSHYLSNIRDLQRDPIGLFMNCHKGKGNVVRLRFGPQRSYYFTHPDHIKHIFQTNASNYRKTTRGYNQLRLLFGDGILTSDGQLWQQQRAVAQVDLRKQNIEEMLFPMKECINALMVRWDGIAQKGGSLDLNQEMGRLALGVVDRTLMKMDFDAEIPRIRSSLNIIYQTMYTRMTHVPNWPLWVPTQTNRDFKNALEYMRQVVRGIINRHESMEQSNLIKHLANLDGFGPALLDSPERRLGAVMTYLVAGHETTANALTWLWRLMSLNPEVDKRNYEEIKRVLGDLEPTILDLKRLTYADQIIAETLRLYPPVWHNSRVSINHDRIGGYDIPANSTVIVSPYAMHRLPQYWDDPEQFDPSRFEPAKIKGINPCVYFPFGVGPRMCIGASFSLQEMKLALVMIARKYKIWLNSDSTVNPLISLPPRNKITAKVLYR